MEAHLTKYSIQIPADDSTAVSLISLWGETGDVHIYWKGHRDPYIYELQGGLAEALRHLAEADGSAGRAANAIKNAAISTWCGRTMSYVEPATV